MSTIIELVEQLPPDLQQEARDFVEFLIEKRVHKPKGDWVDSDSGIHLLSILESLLKQKKYL